MHSAPEYLHSMASHDDEKNSNLLGSLFSRIRKPFAQKTRYFELSIQLDDPHRQYGPGEFVTGDVVLRVIKPIDITHIVVCLHGFVQVYKTPNNPGAKYKEYNAALVTGKTSKAGGYYGNGFASLFEDEVVLCGDGRIPEGLFRFGFEVRFPREQLPSSIDFERGTVSYMITSTLTRPSRASIINPLTTSEIRVAFEDTIDIANILKPKPRVVTLEPIIRRTRTRSRKPTIDGSHTNGSAQPVPQNPEQLQNDHEPPRSPEPSEDSFETGFSSGGTPSASESRAVRPPSVRITEGRVTRSHSRRDGKARSVVTSQVDVQQAGYLRGDIIEIKMQISHYKQIKSLHGVIATLYRQARVDMHPALPVVTDSGDALFPKSRTGLGGLSLSSTGASHQFRKDLDQNWAPIIINQETLSADIKITLCVPESAFPTISTTPGGMISFKYYVEIILDVNAKLVALERYLPTPNVNTLSARNQGLGAPGAHANFRNGYPVDTEDIRREKSVVVTTFEVIIGTRDSKRTTKWQNQRLGQASMADILGNQIPDIVEPSAISRAASSTGPMSTRNGQAEGNLSAQPSLILRPRSATQGTNGTTTSSQHLQVPHRSISFPLLQNDHEHGPAPDYDEHMPHLPSFPIPNLPDESELDEKERLRRAEARLLPSAPPGIDGESAFTGASNAHAPSAPALSDLGPFNPHAQPSAPAFTHPPMLSAPYPVPQSLLSSSSAADHAVPAYDSHSASSSSAQAQATEDKQELERRRLEAARSAPDMAPDTTEGAPSSVVPSSFPNVPSAPPMRELDQGYAPTAPVLNDEDVYGFNAHPMHGELPRYER